MKCYLKPRKHSLFYVERITGHAWGKYTIIHVDAESFENTRDTFIAQLTPCSHQASEENLIMIIWLILLLVFTHKKHLKVQCVKYTLQTNITG